MTKIIPDYLEQSTDRYPRKIAYGDQYESITYEKLRERTCKIAYQLIKRGYTKQPIAIYLEKSVRCVAAMLGVLYSGNYYTVLDMDMPSERIKKIIFSLSPAAVIVDEKNNMQCEGMLEQYDILTYKDVLGKEFDIELVERRRMSISPADLSQVIFTSGSTGMPKGVMLSHGGVVSTTEARTKYFGYIGADIFANQFPFHFVGYLADFFCTLKTGATDYIIPKEMFFSPKRLVEFIKEKKVTVLDWIAPALYLLAKYGALADVTLPLLRIVAFGGEAMPIKYLRIWKKASPSAIFVNAYGSSELGGGILFYRVNNEFEGKDQLPLGVSIEEAEIILLDENDKRTREKGELCVRSSQLAVGYYKNAEETAKKFVYIYDKLGEKTRIFKTGDIVKYNNLGEIIFLGRKDDQIKRRGYRIELGEIECAVNTLDEIKETACIYDKYKEKIVLFYSGQITELKLRKYIEKIIPHYMLPDIYTNLKEIPRNINKKIDRVKLSALYEESCEDV